MTPLRWRPLLRDESNALRALRRTVGVRKKWKRALRVLWFDGRDVDGRYRLSDRAIDLLLGLRNSHGEEWLARLHLEYRDGDE